MKYLVVLLLFVAAFIPVPDSNAWAYRQISGLFFLTIVISLILCGRYHFTVGLCFLVTAAYGLFLGGIPQLSTQVISSVMILLFFSCVAIGLSDSLLDLILPLLLIVAVGDSMLVVIKSAPHAKELWGFMQGYWVMTNASLDACFLSLIAPLLLVMDASKKIVASLLFVFLVAILLSKSNTAIIVFFLSLAITLGLKKNYKTLIGLCFFGLLMGFPIYHFFGSKLGENYGRFANWKLMMEFWQNNIPHALGAGPGTYRFYAQNVEFQKSTDQVFTWMHNDWLQVLFEQGYVGLTSVVLLFGTLLYRSFKRPVLFSMVIGFGCISMTLFPLHLFFFQLVGLGIIHQTFRSEGSLGFT